MLYLFSVYVHAMLLLLLLSEPIRDTHALVLETASIAVYMLALLVFWRAYEFIIYMSSNQSDYVSALSEQVAVG